MVMTTILNHKPARHSDEELQALLDQMTEKSGRKWFAETHTHHVTKRWFGEDKRHTSTNLMVELGKDSIEAQLLGCVNNEREAKAYLYGALGQILKHEPYEDLICELYQVLGALDAPEHVLDQVFAAAQKERLPYKSLLPFILQDSEGDKVDPGASVYLEPVTRLDQIQVGDMLMIDDGKTVYSAPCVEICRRHIDPEVVINRKKNQYFIVSLYLEGSSWVKEVSIVRRKGKPKTAEVWR